MMRYAALALLLFAPACADREPAPSPHRIRLFDLMDSATLETPSRPDAPPATETVVLADFEDRTIGRMWMVVDEPGSEVVDDDGRLGIGDGAGGMGAGLAVGPLAPGEAGAAVLLVPAHGFARYDITGRVRLDHNGQQDSASTREALRVLEHRGEVEDPGSVQSFIRSLAPTHRVSRQSDPSGWDRFSVSFVTRSETGTLELQLRHQDDGSGQSVTRFDDLTVRHTPLTEADLWDHLRGLHAARDGEQVSTPWRIRALLPRAGIRAEEARDAVLLPPPSTLSFPLTLPPAKTAPRLRFHCGMLPDAFEAPGDGARIVVRFRPDGGELTEVGAVDFDPKQNEKDRGWQSVELDLTAHGGQTGVLSFESRDAPGSSKDPLDAVVLGTPRIEPGSGAPDALNVLLIGVDTLRADRVSALGYERPTTPQLERIAREGIRFQKARSQAPWTLPSFASILTSLYPSAHGAGRGGHGEWTGIDPGTTSLAELLARAGYETHGIVANGLLSPRYGLDQGFEGYHFSWARESAKDDASLAAEFIDAHRTTPWLLFWHVMDPHLPYATEPSFWEEFTDADYVGRFSARRSVPTQALHEPGRRAFEGPTPAPELSGADRRFVSDLYDAEIAETDAAIGRVLDALVKSGQWERTIVALVADHGEALGERGYYHHGYTLYDDQVHVPMLLRIPGRDEGRVVDTAVASIDLMPTVLAALGLERPDYFHGVDLLARDFEEEQSYFIESPTYDSSAQKAWVLGDFKYFHDPVFRTEALFDLAHDPGEVTDVAAQHPELVQRARRELERFRWEHLQLGRYHLRVVGRPGQRLTVSIGTDDVFDANFTTRPATPEADVELDLDRRSLVLDTTLEDSRWELVFWGRGQQLDVDVRLDGQPLEAGALLGNADRSRSLPLALTRDEIPALDADDVSGPKLDQALLWLDAGASTETSTLSSPDELEMLRQLGYVR
ncbi:sulfatase [Engelhardtia mirabilis]|uniref:Arylsulfatase n=1 Tax=Engelhardtia mirabilis TaxID=2528011 RepID=A0A518BGU5_9BACT|nr:Arylsulfatase [Planctomycetes bacterium Pla133]QDV00536.1 Arylsulfatase [Planctomycetes bacterium Pla86]